MQMSGCGVPDHECDIVHDRSRLAHHSQVLHSSPPSSDPSLACRVKASKWSILHFDLLVINLSFPYPVCKSGSFEKIFLFVLLLLYKTSVFYYETFLLLSSPDHFSPRIFAKSSLVVENRRSEWENLKKGETRHMLCILRMIFCEILSNIIIPMHFRLPQQQ